MTDGKHAGGLLAVGAEARVAEDVETLTAVSPQCALLLCNE